MSKPFNLEQAKAGSPVCTRSGLSARIICFDRKQSTRYPEKYPIVALVDNGAGDEAVRTYDVTGRHFVGESYRLDLMMVN